jgi:hypothetical protein
MVYYRLPGCQSNYKEHAILLTKALAQILKLNLESKIYREITLKEIGLRPDALVFLKKDKLCLCFCLEICNNEFPEFLQQKINAWQHWNGAKETLSLLFEKRIEEFDIVVSGDIAAEGTFEFNQYLKDLEEVQK